LEKYLGETEKELFFSFYQKEMGLYFIINDFTEKTFVSGDILFVSPKGFLKIVFTTISTDNVLFVTGQCNNYCLMCSQPPTKRNDISFYYKLNKHILKWMPDKTSELGITGGEPTLLEEKLVYLIKQAYAKNPNMAIHLLSNGRAFVKKDYSALFEEFSQHDFIIGVPIHSDYEVDHNRIAGNKTAYSQTLLGLYNLALYNVGIELRIVINQLNYKRLPQIAIFIFRNFPFVKHIAFIGLETTGLMLKNIKQLWIDPLEYIDNLEKAILELSEWGMKTSIYNLPVCLLKPSLYQYMRRSISDWKETFLKECEICILKKECCGVFSTSKMLSKNIKAFV
jgi:His-Xaa-Ser system radical SAM maturase HxsC